jgi:hypothetical protein
MGEAAILDIPKGVVPPASGIGTLGAFFQPSPSCDSRLVRADERLIQELVAVLERQLIAAVEARSVAEFKAVRESVMPRYVRALRALNETVINLVSAESLESLTDKVSRELANDLEKQRDSRFGDKLTDQALFTLWTIRKIRALGREIARAGRAPEDKSLSDDKLRHEYRIVSLWAQFHLDVLFAAMKFDRPIFDETKETICEGLRAAVNAFVIMKDALALRHPTIPADAPTLILPWDEEDERLLASSMRDINVRPPDNR